MKGISEINKKGTGGGVAVVIIMFILVAVAVIGFGAYKGWFDMGTLSVGQDKTTTATGIPEWQKGDSATFSISFRDMVPDTPSSLGDMEGIVTGTGQNKREILIDQASMSSIGTWVGDSVDITEIGNDSYYCDSILGYTITNRAPSTTMDCYGAVTAAQGDTRAYYVQPEDELSSGANDLWAGGQIDYNVTATSGAVLGANQYRNIWLRYSPNTDNKVAHICGLATVGFNDAITPELIGSGSDNWREKAMPRNLSTAAIVVNSSTTIDGWDQYYEYDPDGDGKPNPLKISEWDTNEDLGVFIKAQLECDDTGCAAATTEATLDLWAWQFVDCDNYADKTGYPDYGAFDDSDDNGNVGIQEIVTSPAGKVNGGVAATV